MEYMIKKLELAEKSLNSALFIPKINEGEKYPLVLFLHGAGERGTNIELITNYRGPDVFTSDEWQKEHPCFVLMPQCPEDMTWLNFTDVLENTIMSLPGEYPIDNFRIYVTGLSMGGAGTWWLLSRAHRHIAAAMPICGYADPYEIRVAKNVPIWAFHAQDDDTVPVTGSRDLGLGYGVGTRQLVSVLRSEGAGDVHYTEYPEGYIKENFNTGAHASWLAAYSDKNALEWMFSKNRFERYTVELLRPGVYHIQDYDRDSIYLVEGRKKALLIDTGMGGSSLPELVSSLTPLPIELAITHAHGDHMALTHLFGKFYMSEKDIPFMEGMKSGKGKGNTSTADDVIGIKDGDVIDLGEVEIEVVELGGHTPGSVVFIDRMHGCVFTGDALGLWMQVPMALPISEYRTQLARFKEKLSKPGYTELAFYGGHKWQEGGELPRAAYKPNSYERVDDMLDLCDLLLKAKLKTRSYPIKFDEPAFEAVYRTADMVFKKSVLK